MLACTAKREIPRDGQRALFSSVEALHGLPFQNMEKIMSCLYAGQENQR